MKENATFWPRVNIENVDPAWWEEVMSTSRLFESHYSTQLDEASDFTIRAIVHVVYSKAREEVKWFFEGSLQSEKLLEINSLINNPDEGRKQEGTERIIKLIEEYNALFEK